MWDFIMVVAFLGGLLLICESFMWGRLWETLIGFVLCIGTIIYWLKNNSTSTQSSDGTSEYNPDDYPTERRNENSYNYNEADYNREMTKYAERKNENWPF